MKSQEKLQQELNALIQLMLDTGIAVKQEQIASAVRVIRKDHTKYVISPDDKTIRLHDAKLINELTNNSDNEKSGLFTQNRFKEYVLNLRFSNDQINPTNLNAFKKLLKKQIDECNREQNGACAYFQALTALNNLRQKGVITNTYPNNIRCSLEIIRKNNNNKDEIVNLEAALKMLKKEAFQHNYKAFKSQLSLLALYIKKFISYCGKKLKIAGAAEYKTQIKLRIASTQHSIGANKLDANLELAVCSSVNFFRKTMKRQVNNIKPSSSAHRPL